MEARDPEHQEEHDVADDVGDGRETFGRLARVGEGGEDEVVPDRHSAAHRHHGRVEPEGGALPRPESPPPQPEDAGEGHRPCSIGHDGCRP